MHIIKYIKCLYLEREVMCLFVLRPELYMVNIPLIQYFFWMLKLPYFPCSDIMRSPLSLLLFFFFPSPEVVVATVLYRRADLKMM